MAADVPASLLARRPDLAAAELRLRKTLATSDATVASCYPNLNLTGALGTASSSLLKFFSGPAASLGAVLSLAELNPQKVWLTSGIARADDYEIAAQDFRQTFYDALRETQVRSRRGSSTCARPQFADANFTAERDAEQPYERQYRARAIALRASAIRNRYILLVTQVEVYQALGGEAEAPQCAARLLKAGSMLNPYPKAAEP